MNDLNWIAALTFGISIAGLAWMLLLLGALKISDRARISRNLGEKQRRGKIDRRKIKTNPNIVCGFPIFQKAREEAPFF